ncbi:hypothetical protein LTR37_004305 [Vermiconidia calcicola]|uniref:Uncharacterized protein n=1 Tax=Vermiconidia calcicola TaxID=1690605 RepID=A0ACC3NNI0_9PEZI|nr:hypothetical protein LTR37_004305 [Vermiconidia calcicola]
MSLVNLAHVCSHLQNASLARLGLTSIPYSRLHLSLSLLLHKQGFLSQVKLAGPSPPASCFPPGLRDHAPRISGHPYAYGEGDALSLESALQKAINGVNEQGLRSEGFGEEAIHFAMQERLKSKAQLEREGWDEVAMEFLLRQDGKSREQLEADGMDAEMIALIEQHRPMLEDAKREIQKWHGDQQTFETREADLAAQSLRRPTPYTTHLRSQLRSHLLRAGFPEETLRYFAGPQNTLRTPRDLSRDGITLNINGLAVQNQPYSPPPPPDPWDLETEGVVTQANRASRRLWLGLKYWDGQPVLKKAKMLSKPTKRIWLTSKELGGLTRGYQAAKGEVKPANRRFTGRGRFAVDSEVAQRKRGPAEDVYAPRHADRKE